VRAVLVDPPNALFSLGGFVSEFWEDLPLSLLKEGTFFFFLGDPFSFSVLFLPHLGFFLVDAFPTCLKPDAFVLREFDVESLGSPHSEIEIKFLKGQLARIGSPLRFRLSQTFPPFIPW